MKLINCYHIKKSRPAGGVQFMGAGQLVALSLMCLMLISDFQLQIANRCAQEEDDNNNNNNHHAGQQQWQANTTNHQRQQQQQQVQSDTSSSSGGRSLGEASGGRRRRHSSSSSCGAPLVLLASANSDANRLYEDLMMTYNRIVRPVQNNSDRVVVRLSLKLSQLIDVNLKNQMMTTNVWLNQEWSDYKLKWDPSEYGGIEDINLPAEQIWLPDIVLYNSAEGYFAVSIMTKAKVRYDGHVTWNPPAIFRSSCQIDITYFPFDSQNCHLKFGSWTFGTKIDLRHINDTEQSIERGTDLSEYYQNVEWDIMQASARRNVITYICCPNDFYPDVTFNFTLRRKPLFYTVNLILPCVGITILSFLVFYLPSDSGEKVTLTISILVSLIFFLSVLIETIPSTSLAMPLLGKYLVFTMILITVSVCATVCVLNIHFRTPSTHSMAPWVKRWCIDILPKYLFMNVPQYQSQQANILPEQLVYLHNSAYQAAAAAAAATAATPTTATAANQTATTKANHKATSSSDGNGAQPLAWNGKTVSAAAAAAATAADASQLRQLDPGALMSEQLDLVGKTLNASPSQSLFLPYLQSEAARRLKLQRSRSSERDNRSASECQPPTANNTNNANQLAVTCDRVVANQTAAAAQVTIDMQQQQEASKGDNGGGRSAAGKPSKKQRRTSRSFWRGFWAGGSKSPPTSSTTESAGATVRGGASGSGGGGSSSARRESRESRRDEASRSHHHHHNNNDDDDEDSSSSIENDYQHHNHFQARASICSTNLWRIGPTRRCSLAVPANYPTYYRPLVQLQAPMGAAAGGGGHNHQQQLSTLSACVQAGHYHTHLPSPGTTSSQSSSSLVDGQRGVVGALVTAASSNLTLHAKQAFLPGAGNRAATAAQLKQSAAAAESAGDGQELRQLNSTGLIRAPQLAPTVVSTPQLPYTHHSLLSQKQQQQQQQQHHHHQLHHQQPLLYPLNAHPSARPSGSQLISDASGATGGSSRPTPPPPLPPLASLSHHHHQQQQPQQQPVIDLRRIVRPDQRQQQQQQLNQVGSRPPAQMFAAPYSSGVLLRPAELVAATDEPTDASLKHHPHAAAHHAASEQQQSTLHFPLQYSSGQLTKSSMQSGHHVSLNGNLGLLASGGTQQQRQLDYGQQQQQQHLHHMLHHHHQQQQMMPRSRSTDHRLYATSYGGLQAPVPGGAITQDMPHPQHTNQEPPHHQRLYGGGGIGTAAQTSHSIGRALGQAYMQRLQRQPTIYSLHSSVQRPSRPIQRGAYIIPLDMHQQQRQWLAGDQMRRSKSQTSLNRRAQLGMPGASNVGPADCEQCRDLRDRDRMFQASGRCFECDDDDPRRRLNSLGACATQLRCRQPMAAQRQTQEECSCQLRGDNSGRQYGGSYETSGGLIEAARDKQQDSSGCRAWTTTTTRHHHNHQNRVAQRGDSLGPRCPSSQQQQQPPPLTTLGLMKLINDVDKAIQNAMFIAQHIDNLDEFESVKENWKYIAMVIDRIFLIVFLFACIVGTVTIFAMVPWSLYTHEKPIDLQLTRLMALNLTGTEPYLRPCQEF